MRCQGARGVVWENACTLGAQAENKKFRQFSGCLKRQSAHYTRFSFFEKHIRLFLHPFFRVYTHVCCVQEFGIGQAAQRGDGAVAVGFVPRFYIGENLVKQAA